MRTKAFISLGLVPAAWLAFGSASAQTNSPPVPGAGRPGVASANQTNAPPLAPTGRVSPSGEDDLDSPVNRLSRELHLDTDQKSKVQAVLDQTRTRIQTAVQQAMTNADAELHRILTPDQYSKLRQLEHPAPNPQSGPSSKKD